ncbi:MAG TPA: hypothetical protein VEL28_18035 [Candidatus Binatia bacterium]|nr:hypothetical protein [Candidatus Binatia bacterium]
MAPGAMMPPGVLILVRIAAVLAGIGAIAVSLLPLYDPPTSTPLPVLVAVPTLQERLFPGVALDWVVRRLTALLLGAALIVAGTLRRTSAEHPADREAALRAPRQAVNGSPVLRIWLLLSGALLAAASLAAPWMSRPMQLGFVAALVAAVVIALLLEGLLRAASRPRIVIPYGAAVLAAVWLAVRLPLSLRSYRLGDAVDYLSGYFCYEDLAEPVINLLTSSCWTGQGYMPGVLFGQGLLGWDVLELARAQTIAACWTAAVCVLVGQVVARRLGQSAAIVASAVLLWSPIVLVRPLAPGHFVASALVALALYFAQRVRSGESPAAAAALGATAGLAMHSWPSLPPVLCLAALSLPAILRSRTAAIAALCFFAAAAIPAMGQHVTWWQHLGDHTLSLTTVEAIYSGRVAPFLIPGSRDLVLQDRTALVIGALLSMFAAPRASIGLWGDLFVEPIGSALAAVGLLACIVAAVRSPAARPLLLFVLACLSAALLVRYDRIHGAGVEIAIPAALLAAAGWQQLTRGWASAPLGLALSLVLAGAIGLSGTTIFDEVNPRILAPTVPGLALRAGHVFDHNVAWSPGMFADTLPPLRVLAHFVAKRHVVGWNPAKIHRMLPEPEQAAAFWSQGDEMESLVASVLCTKPSNRSLYEVSDASGDVRMFAAVRTDLEPVPATAAVTWTRRECSEPLPTDAVRAKRDLAAARDMIESGRREEALTMLRQTTQATVAQPRLYLPLAQILATGSEAERREALAWALLACRMTQGSYFEACTLASELGGQQDKERIESSSEPDMRAGRLRGHRPAPIRAVRNGWKETTVSTGMRAARASSGCGRRCRSGRRRGRRAFRIPGKMRRRRRQIAAILDRPGRWPGVDHEPFGVADHERGRPCVVDRQVEEPRPDLVEQLEVRCSAIALGQRGQAVAVLVEDRNHAGGGLVRPDPGEIEAAGIRQAQLAVAFRIGAEVRCNAAGLSADAQLSACVLRRAGMHQHVVGAVEQRQVAIAVGTRRSRSHRALVRRGPRLDETVALGSRAHRCDELALVLADDLEPARANHFGNRWKHGLRVQRIPIHGRSRWRLRLSDGITEEQCRECQHADSAQCSLQRTHAAPQRDAFVLQMAEAFFGRAHDVESSCLRLIQNSHGSTIRDAHTLSRRERPDAAAWVASCR